MSIAVHPYLIFFFFKIKYDCTNGLYYFSRAESFDIIHRKQIHEHGSGYSVRAFMLGVSLTDMSEKASQEATKRDSHFSSSMVSSCQRSMLG